jgi:cell wall assembly regulator SMI1
MRHDGDAYLTDYEYLPVAQILSAWEGKKRAFDDGVFQGREVTEKGGGLIRNFWWHPGWIPFGQDSAGNLLCIDMVPGCQGRRGQILRWEREEGPLPGPGRSFHEWLRRYRDDLLGGAFDVSPEGLIQIRP